MFIDTAVIEVCAGSGGDGAVTFHREKYVASGGPDGGDGGRGGDVIIQVDGGVSTLSAYRYRRKFTAKNGENGKGGRCFGKSGESVTLTVPRGTLVYDDASGRLLADMSADEPFTVAHGGRGGYGNAHFASSTRQVPRFAKPGLPGEHLRVRLELKLLADVGLVGFPNVGKSTLLSVVSEAKPVVADYPFTTLSPVLGVVREGDESFVMADIPGIIEGASGGTGLGHDFLRHIQRCRLLVHVVDVSGSEGRDPLRDFEVIQAELEAFSPELAKLPMLVAANKCDLATEEQIAAFKSAVAAKGYACWELMAPIAQGTRELVRACVQKLRALPPVKAFAPDPPAVSGKDAPISDRVPKVLVRGNTYEVTADWLLPVLRTVDVDDEESLRYFQRLLASSGILRALEEAGIHEGDTVSLYGFDFEYVR